MFPKPSPRRVRTASSRRVDGHPADVDRFLHQTHRRPAVARSHGRQRPETDDPPDPVGYAGLPAGGPAPGTGDVHLSIIGELKIDAAVIVSTPQQIAVADVVRGVEMFRNENVNIPVAGIIENMAWFTPAELPGKPLLHLRPRRSPGFRRAGAEWISWAKSPSCSRSWKEGRRDALRPASIPVSKSITGNRRKGGFKSDEKTVDNSPITCR